MSSKHYKWTSDMEVGIAEIDKQHANLFDRLNKLVDSMTGGGSERDVNMMIKFLENYVVMHFSIEERFMTETKYPDLAPHKKEHESLIAAIDDFKSAYESQGITPALVDGIEQKVGDWLVNHIGRVDKELSGYLIEKGVAGKKGASGH